MSTSSKEDPVSLPAVVLVALAVAALFVAITVGVIQCNMTRRACLEAGNTALECGELR